MNEKIVQEIEDALVEILKQNDNLSVAQKALEEQLHRTEETVKFYIKGIMATRFLAIAHTEEEFESFVKKHNLKLVSDETGFVGVSTHNRWLYTFDGRVVGKKNGKFNL